MSTIHRSGLRMRRHPAVHGTSGALAGSAAGVGLAATAAAAMPAVALPVWLAMGVLFGAFNGSLLALLARFSGR